MLTLDGSTLEGGGQLVRVALSLSSIYAIPVHITNIRAGRGPRSTRTGPRRGTDTARGSTRRAHGRLTNNGDQPPRQNARGYPAAGGGLKESHLAAVLWLADKCHATLQGASVGQADLVFKPASASQQRNFERVKHADKGVDGTEDLPECIELTNPGSVWLIWQAIFPYIVFKLIQQVNNSGGSQVLFRITLRGGTNVPKAPSSEYVQQVFLQLCEKIGLPKVDINVKRRGWAGSAPQIGEVEIVVHYPVLGNSPETRSSNFGRLFKLPSFQLRDRGIITKINMTILAGSQETFSLLESQLTASLNALNSSSGAFPASTPITTHPDSDTSSGDERRLSVLLVAETSNGFRIGRDCLGSGRKMVDDGDRRKIVAEVVGTVTREFIAECLRPGCVDEYAEDQIVIFQALAEGDSLVEAGHASRRNGFKGTRESQRDEGEGGDGSLHTRTVRWVCEEMLGTVFAQGGKCEGGGNTKINGLEDLRDDFLNLDISGNH